MDPETRVLLRLILRAGAFFVAWALAFVGVYAAGFASLNIGRGTDAGEATLLAIGLPALAFLFGFWALFGRLPWNRRS